MNAFFEARSIAVIGSFKEQQMGGYGVIKNLLDFGFSGAIYPVNPSYTEVLGMKVFPTVDRVPHQVDLAIIITPTTTVPAVVAQCAGKGIRAAIVVSDGFAETGEEGRRLQGEMVDAARHGGVRLVGPNTIGTVGAANRLVTTPYFCGYKKIQPGSIAYTAQTGIVGAQALPLEDWAYPISKMCDLGNKCDVSEVDLLEYLAADAESSVISMHVEDIRDGRRFMEAARKAAAQKPVLVLKPGRNETSARAMASHTGSLAGNDRMYSTAFEQAGVYRLDIWQEFLEVPRVFASQPLPKGNRLAIVTVTGGAGIMAVDAAIRNGLSMARLSDATAAKLAGMSPRIARNPVDVGQMWTLMDNYAAYFESVVAALLDDDNVDCILVIGLATRALPTEATIEAFSKLKQRATKPVAMWTYGTSLPALQELSRGLEPVGMPNFTNLETAVKALGIAVKYAGTKARMASIPFGKTGI